MKRQELLRSKEYWMVQVQNDLYGVIEEYMRKKDLNRTKLADELGVTKGYITQIFKGDFDHKLSKFIDLALTSHKAPLVNFVDLDEYIKLDAEGKYLELMPTPKPRGVAYEKQAENYIKPAKWSEEIKTTSTSTQSAGKSLIPSFDFDFQLA